MEDEGLSRRGLFSLGLGRIRRQWPDLPEFEPAVPAEPAGQSPDLDLHAISRAPIAALAELAGPQPGEDILVVRGGGLEDAFGEHGGLIAVAEAGELEDLPFDDDEFDRALAPFAPIYATDPRTAMQELFRVVKPGGVVAVTAWTEEGGVGDVLQASTTWDPEVDSRLAWGYEPRLRTELEREGEEAEVVRRALAEPGVTAADLERALPPVAEALAAFPGADANGLRAHAARLLAEHTLTGAYLVGTARAAILPTR
jgi:SAM-dependent methyltransferase